MYVIRVKLDAYRHQIISRTNVRLIESSDDTKIAKLAFIYCHGLSTKDMLGRKAMYYDPIMQHQNVRRWNAALFP